MTVYALDEKGRFLRWPDGESALMQSEDRCYKKESQNCQMWIDLKKENGFRIRNGQGLRICNYFYRMAYSFFTITSLKSSLKL